MSAFLWAFVEVLNGSWALIGPMLFAGAFCAWKFWDTRRRLNVLARDFGVKTVAERTFSRRNR